MAEYLCGDHTEKELMELVEKAVESCKTNTCSDCPFKIFSSKCKSVLTYKTKKTKQGGEVV